MPTTRKGEEPPNADCRSPQGLLGPPRGPQFISLARPYRLYTIAQGRAIQLDFEAPDVAFVFNAMDQAPAQEAPLDLGPLRATIQSLSPSSLILGSPSPLTSLPNLKTTNQPRLSGFKVAPAESTIDLEAVRGEIVQGALSEVMALKETSGRASGSSSPGELLSSVQEMLRERGLRT